MHDLLERLAEWKVLEGRAILEIVRGRLAIIEKFNSALVLNMPEKAPTGGAENLHDLIASYPWLMDPEWQALYEEKGVGALLRELQANDPNPTDRSRVDFLALAGPGKLLVIEIKRTGHVVERADVRRLEDYTDRIRQAYPDAEKVFISGDNYQSHVLDEWPDAIRRLTWAEVYRRTSSYYEQYRALLEGDVADPSFTRRQQEHSQTNRILTQGAYTPKEGEPSRLGPQDLDYPLPPPVVRPGPADRGDEDVPADASAE
jgi:hypothetical protein